MQILDPAVAAHLVQRLEARAAEAHLTQRLAEQLGQGVLVLVRDAGQRGVETQPSVDADDKQVERVGQALLDLSPPPIDLLLEPDHRQVVTEDGARDQRDDEVERVGQKEADQQSQRGQHGQCDRRPQPEHARGHADVEGVGGEEVGRVRRAPVCQHVGELEVREGEDHREHGDDDEHGFEHRERDVPEALGDAGAVDGSGLV